MDISPPPGEEQAKSIAKNLQNDPRASMGYLPLSASILQRDIVRLVFQHLVLKPIRRLQNAGRRPRGQTFTQCLVSKWTSSHVLLSFRALQLKFARISTTGKQFRHLRNFGTMLGCAPVGWASRWCYKHFNAFFVDVIMTLITTKLCSTQWALLSATLIFASDLKWKHLPLFLMAKLSPAW